MVNRELDEMKQRNEQAEKQFTIEAERLANIQKELHPEVVRQISRFQRLLNFKLEFRLKLLVKRSLRLFNTKLEAVILKYYSVMEIDPKQVDLFKNPNEES